MVPISTRRFAYHKPTRTLVGEVSEIRAGGGGRLPITSARTGRTVEFRLVKVHKDPEGDVQFWEYRAADVPGVAVHVFND